MCPEPLKGTHVPTVSLANKGSQGLSLGTECAQAVGICMVEVPALHQKQSREDLTSQEALSI